MNEKRILTVDILLPDDFDFEYVTYKVIQVEGDDRFYLYKRYWNHDKGETDWSLCLVNSDFDKIDRVLHTILEASEEKATIKVNKKTEEKKTAPIVRIINQNACAISTSSGIYLQSYKSIVAKIGNDYRITVYPKWDYSMTTTRAVNQFLHKTAKEIRKGIKEKTITYESEEPTLY